MIDLPKILVIDDSTVLRQVMSAVLKPHCGAVVTAEDCAQARRRMREHPDISLVLCDVVLPDGNGLDLLEEIASQTPRRPDVIMMTARPDGAAARRAEAAGATGYLAKPISFRDIVDVLHRSKGKRAAAPRIRRRPLGQAHLLGRPGAGVAAAVRDGGTDWDIRDISASGAFLETPGPIAVGTPLELCLDFGTSQARVLARAVRVQEPNWGLAGGVGIAFREFDAGSRELLMSHLDSLAGDPR